MMRQTKNRLIYESHTVTACSLLFQGKYGHSFRENVFASAKSFEETNREQALNQISRFNHATSFSRDHDEDVPGNLLRLGRIDHLFVDQLH